MSVPTSAPAPTRSRHFPPGFVWGAATAAFQIEGAAREEPGQGIPATKHQAQAMRNFKQEDLNGDGYISQDELQQTK